MSRVYRVKVLELERRNDLLMNRLDRLLVLVSENTKAVERLLECLKK